MAALAQEEPRASFHLSVALTQCGLLAERSLLWEAQPGGVCCDTVVCGFANLQFEAASSVPVR